MIAWRDWPVLNWLYGKYLDWRYWPVDDEDWETTYAEDPLGGSWS